MGKTVLKKAGTAVAETMIRDLLPFLDERFNALQEQIRAVDTRVRAVEGQIASLKDDVQDRCERQLNLTNEVNGKMIRLEGRIEGFMEAMRIPMQPMKMKRRAG